MATPPYLPPLYLVLQALGNDFQLTDEQLAALPPLDEVELVAHSDNHLIKHAEPGVYTYHPYKLFIGYNENDAFYAYLQRRGGRKQYQIELCSVDTKYDTHYAPTSAIYYGTVNNLAYPFNTYLGSNRFAAVVKWYFLLAFRAGEFDEDPGFPVSASWTKELQGACNDLIAAPRIEANRKLRDKEKEATEMKRKVTRQRIKSQDAIRQTTDHQKTNALSMFRIQGDDRSHQISARNESAIMTESENETDQRDPRRGRGRQLREKTATVKSKTNKQGTVPSEQRPTQRRKIETAAKNHAEKPANGTTDDGADGEDDTTVSWSEEVVRLTSVEEDEVTEVNGKGEASGKEQALREAKWMRLFRQKIETARQMRDLEDEMTVNERLDVFDKVKYA